MLRAKNVDRENRQLKKVLERFVFFKNVFIYCSKITAEKFFKSEFDARMKYGFKKGLFPIQLISLIVQSSID